jgi:hypothetical protein
MRKDDKLVTFVCRLYRNSGCRKLLEPKGLSRTTGIALPLHLLHWIPLTRFLNNGDFMCLM